MSEIPGVAEVFDSDLEFVRGFGDAITGVTRFWRWRVWAVTVSPTDDGGVELHCRCILAIDPAEAGLSLCHLVNFAAQAATALGANGAR
jgi:hypothetical protein